MTISILRTPTALLLSMLLAATSSGQQVQTRTMTLNPDSVAIVPGLGAVIESRNDTLSVLMIPPAEARGADYKGVDLSERDRILMVNGKSMRAARDFAALLEGAAVGDTIKLAVKRNSTLLMTSFIKADPAKQSGPMMIRQTVGDNAGAESGVTTSVVGGGVLVCGGLLARTGDSGVIVKARLPQAAEPIEGQSPAAGDRILSFNGQSVRDASSLQALNDAIPTGDTVTIELERNGAPYTVRYVQAPFGQGLPAIKKK